MNKKNNKRSCIASLRDMCIILEDGTEWPLSEEVEIESKPIEADTPDERLSLEPWSVSVTVQLTTRGEAWLLYHLLVRPWLYCPVEYRLN